MAINQAKTKITKPVSIEDVRQVLVEGSHDLATLCKSNKINRFSVYKPINYNALTTIPYDVFVSMGYGLVLSKYSDTSQSLVNFAAFVDRLILAGNWDGIVYDKNFVHHRLSDFADKDNANYGYDSTATLVEEYYDTRVSKTHFVPSNMHNVDFTQGTPADEAIREVDWANVAVSIESARNHKDANIFDIISCSVVGGNDSQHLASMNNMKHGVMVWYDNIYLVAFNSIKWSEWRDILSTTLDGGNTSVTYNYAEFYTQDTNMQRPLHIIPFNYGRVVFTFDYGVSLVFYGIVYDPQREHDYTDSANSVTLNGKKFNELPYCEIYYGYYFPATGQHEVAVSKHNLSNVNSNTYFFPQIQDPTNSASQHLTMHFVAYYDSSATRVQKHVIFDCYTAEYMNS